uniref:MULE transposase domain-containing protein n=1 Tax=Timema poppense TaxID=170557 RepID=A0A7R9D1B0_TIMPO|nr:unnamed protein product [Timema poppensis]
MPKLNYFNSLLMVKSLIESGITLQHILDKICVSATEENFQRIHMITKKDLENICREFSLHTEKQNTGDATNVDVWVDGMNSLSKEENPVVFYKARGTCDMNNILSIDDFCLVIMTSFQKNMLEKFGTHKICVDCTQPTNAYDFTLTTIMTVDEFGSGFPTAFCVSNRKDSLMWTFFFELLKDKLQMQIKAEIFMSDDNEALYDAWDNVMGKTCQLQENDARSIEQGLDGLLYLFQNAGLTEEITLQPKELSSKRKQEQETLHTTKWIRSNTDQRIPKPSLEESFSTRQHNALHAPCDPNFQHLNSCTPFCPWRSMTSCFVDQHIDLTPGPPTESATSPALVDEVGLPSLPGLDGGDKACIRRPLLSFQIVDFRDTHQAALSPKEQQERINEISRLLLPLLDHIHFLLPNVLHHSLSLVLQLNHFILQPELLLLHIESSCCARLLRTGRLRFESRSGELGSERSRSNSASNSSLYGAGFRMDWKQDDTFDRRPMLAQSQVLCVNNASYYLSVLCAYLRKCGKDGKKRNKKYSHICMKGEQKNIKEKPPSVHPTKIQASPMASNPVYRVPSRHSHQLIVETSPSAIFVTSHLLRSADLMINLIFFRCLVHGSQLR